MVMIVKKPSQYDRVSIGLLGVALCVFAVIPSGSVLGEDRVSQVQESKVGEEQTSVVRAKSQTHKWTVPCEREDGTQGIFRVSSNVADENSSLDFETDTESAEIAEKPPTPNIQAPVPSESEEDPFGNPTLKCGRLLTLLAIFAHGESQAPR